MADKPWPLVFGSPPPNMIERWRVERFSGRHSDGAASGEAGARQGRSGLGAHPPRGRRHRAARAGARHLHLFDHPAPRHARSGRRAPAGGAARSCRGLGRIDPAGLCGCAQGHARDRRGFPRRPHGDGRPRSGDPSPDRAGALLQGLSRHPDPSAGALAVGQGPPRFRALPAEPLVGGVPVRHPSGRARSGAAFSSIMPPASSSARPR